MMRIRAIMIALTAALAAGCGGNGGGQDDGYPDPSFVFEAAGHTDTASDEPFLQERVRMYRTQDVLPGLDVRSLVVIDDDVWVGGTDGLFRYDPAADSFVRITLPAETAVIDIARRKLDDGRLVIASASDILLLDTSGSSTEVLSMPEEPTSAATDGSDVWAGTATGLFRRALGQMAAQPGVDHHVRALDFDGNGHLWAATDAGLFEWDGSSWHGYTQADGKLPDDDVRAVFGLAEGGVLAGCATGAAFAGTANDRVLTAGIGALPYDDVTSTWASGNLYAFGHGIGATVVEGDFDHVDHYHSLRWIPAERVNAVALLPDGTRWIATNQGVSRITLEQTTLEQKAALFESFNPRFWRLDFVSCEGRLEDPWKPDEPLTHWDHDNDGLWTEMQVAAWSYAAAATGDSAYCEKARRAMRGMMRLIDIPAVSFEAIGRERGFVARSFVRDDEQHLFPAKATDPQWVLVENFAGEGHDYYWKSDTSSDETTGHFFGYPLYFDFCAGEQERREIAEHLGALARTIVDHDFYLVDLDGEPTTWGHWGFEHLPIALDGVDECMKQYTLERCYSAAYGGGWLNAIEILGHMLAAYHVTGDRAFYDAYIYLLDHRYAELVDFSEDVWTVTKRFVANHSDHELAMLAYHTLIRYEPDDSRRQRWIDSLLGMYEWEIPERNPLWSAIVAAFVPEGYRLGAALRTLREWPEDWREWLVDNSHRKDAELDPELDRHGDEQFTTVLPYDEIRTMKWNGNPYAVKGGGDGRTVQAPWPWLLPYWMMRYYGILQ